MTSRRGHASEEEGSALIIALVFITAISLIVAAVLSFADVGLRASKAYKASAGSAYAAGGAIEAAIKRYSTTGPCDNFTAPNEEGNPEPINGQGVIVRCVGPPPAGSKATQPANSLLSLADSGDGIRYANELRLLGDVFSNTTVAPDPGAATMVVQGEVSARGACTGRILTVPPTPLHCAPPTPSSADTSRGRDPEYVPATTAVPELQNVPACPSGWLVDLKPGYYDDAAGLNALTADPANCHDKVVWFEPGTYYFDLGFRGGPNTWTVNNDTITVVGGRPNLSDWNPTVNPAASAPPKTPKVPGSCLSDADLGPGVQLIAGGSTRLEVLKGRMELCAPKPSTTEQQIALFGLGRPHPFPDPDGHTLEASNIVADGFNSCSPEVGAACSPALNAQTIGETPVRTADADLNAALPSASFTLEGFRPGVPTGSKIDSVSLRVDHQDTGGPVTHTVTADFPDSTCKSTNPPLPLPASGRLDLVLACNLTRPEDLAALKVTYAASVTPGVGATVKVDGAVIEAAYRIPVTYRPTMVVAAPGFTDPASALEIGEQPAPLTARADLSATNPSASITLAGLGEPPLPDNAVIDSAVLRVAHQGGGAAGPPTVTVASTAGPPCTVPLIKDLAVVTDERVDLKAACGIDSATKLRDLTARFDAALGPTDLAASFQLDGIWLEVVSSDGPGAVVQPPVVRRPQVATSTGFDPATADQAKIIGEGLNADATMSNATTSASLAVNDFSGLPLAPGSKITSAKLQVAHQEDANIASVGVTANVPGCPATPLTPSVGALRTDPVDLTSCVTSADQLAGLAASYTANRKTSDPATDPKVTEVPKGATANGFLNPENAQAIDGTLTANALLSSPDKTTATVDLKGFNQALVPPGSIIDNATLRVAHRDEANVTPSVQVSLPASNCTLTLPAHPTLSEDTFPNLQQACGLTDPAQLADLSVTYKAAMITPDGTPADFLDGVALDITYRPPAKDMLDGIRLDLMVQAPALRPLCAGCELLKVAPAAADVTSRFVAGGTIYAPSASVDISMNGVDSPVLKRGVVARSIRLGLKAKDGYKRPSGAIPPEIVTFTAYPDDPMLSANPPTATGFDNPDRAMAIGEPPPGTADALLVGSDPAKLTATLELSGFTVPEGSPIVGAVLKVRHQDDGNTVLVTVKVGTTTCITQDLVPSATTTALSDDLIELAQNVGPKVAACTLDTPAKLAAIKVIYGVGLASADPPAMATAKLDGIAVLPKPLVRSSVTFDRAKATVVGYSVLR